MFGMNFFYISALVGIIKVKVTCTSVTYGIGLKSTQGTLIIEGCYSILLLSSFQRLRYGGLVKKQECE